MATSNLFLRLRKALDDLKSILGTNAAILKPALQTLKLVLPQAGTLVSQLVAILSSLKTEIQNLNVSTITGLPQLASFATSAETLLQTAEDLLPDDQDNIDNVFRVLSVVEALPSFDAVKQDILTLIDGIISDLDSLNS